MSLESLRVDARFHRLLRSKGIETPTPIQAKAIPAALTGGDLVAIAQTGTGKTLAFGLPALTRLAQSPRHGTSMLVLAPTRELAHQVHEVLTPLAKAVGLTTACIYGGVGMAPQTTALRRGANIVVACPGRLLDHMGEGNILLGRVSILVLDEADRMLDMGFLPDIRRILFALPRERQTMMFSATFPPEIARLAATMMRDPARVEAGPVSRPVDSVRQLVYSVSKQDKPTLLKNILRLDEVGSTLVFVRTKRSADKLAKVLLAAGFPVDAIHGDQSQNRRQRSLDGFKSGRHEVLVATDVAARGLDVKGISHVINYDLPGTAEDYVHRIGRTGRADATGDAITFVTHEETQDLRAIERALGRQIERARWSGMPEVAAPASAADLAGERRPVRAHQQARPQRSGGGRPHRGQGRSGGQARPSGGSAPSKVTVVRSW